MMASYVIQVWAVAGRVITGAEVEPGMYLTAFDPDAHGGYGFAVFTKRLEDAMTFDSAPAALECWRKQSTVRPRREDGKPNRPLTAFTISVERRPS